MGFKPTAKDRWKARKTARAIEAENTVFAWMHDHPRHTAHEIAQGVKMRPIRVFKALEILMARGLVEDSWSEPNRRGYKRRYYDLTPAGVVRHLMHGGET